MWSKVGTLCAPCLLAAVVLLGVSGPSRASIEYTDIPDTVVSEANANLEIDFLGAGTKQFDIHWKEDNGICSFDIITNSGGPPFFSPFIAGGVYYSTAFDEGQWISSTSGGGFRSLVVDDGNSQTGNWTDQDLHYLGVSIQPDGEKLYGWIAAQYNHSAGELTVFGYAYETVANTPIQAGATPEPATLTLLGAGAIALLRRK